MSIQSNILPRPGTITNIVGIPQDLRNIPQWVLWKPLLKDGKVAKVPCFLGSDGIDHTNPANWRSFDAVVADMQSDPHGRYGIGLVLAGSGIICIDHDDHPGGDEQAVREGAETIREMLVPHPTYAETSISGKGQHVFYRGILPHGRTYGGVSQYSFEIYSDRFIAITGNTTSAWGAPTPVADGQVIIDAWKLPEIARGAPTIAPTVALGRRLDLEDRDVINTLRLRRPTQFAILNSPAVMTPKRGGRFMEIIGDLDKITGDPAQIDRIIRKMPAYSNAYNRERYDESENWLAKKNLANMFEYWLTHARNSNTESIPALEYITEERREFLNSVMSDTLDYQAKKEGARELADATRTIAELPKASETPAIAGSSLPATDYLIRDEQMTAIGYDYPYPHDPWAMFDPPALPRGLLPRVLEGFAFGRADIMGCDESGLAMAALTVCASAITDRIKLKMKRHDDWYEATRMWVSLVGDPSIKKSPIINAASQPLEAIEKVFRKRYEEQVKQFEALDPEAKKTTSPPAWKRRIVEDTTIEALQNVLHANAECILCRRDELSSWFGSMDRYSGGGKGASADRGFWLQGYNGGGYTLDRISRGNKFIEYLSVNILGGIQPSVLQKIYKDTEDDGTMQRLFPVVLRSGGIGRDIPDDGSADQYRMTVSNLFYLTSVDIQNGSPDGATLSFDPAAQRIFEEVQTWVHKLEALEAINKKLATAIGKWNGVFGRLALLFHLIDACSVPREGESPRNIANQISERTALRVWDFMRVFLLQHLLAFHKNVMGSSDMQDDVEATAEFLLSCGKAQVKFRDVHRGVQRKDSTHETLIAAMEQLEQYGWVDRIEGGRRDSLSWFVNAECHRKFAAKAQAVIEKRKAARAAIEEATAIRREEKAQGSSS